MRTTQCVITTISAAKEVAPTLITTLAVEVAFTIMEKVAAAADLAKILEEGQVVMQALIDSTIISIIMVVPDMREVSATTTTTILMMRGPDTTNTREAVVDVAVAVEVAEAIIIKTTKAGRHLSTSSETKTHLATTPTSSSKSTPTAIMLKVGESSSAT